jgi:crotonobetainyl-CoA:carnitine CoA-transferase CaiB-like acyl-CoA transferase
MIGRSDLQGDAALAQVAGRMARFAEWNEIVHAWTRKHTTAEIVEKASLLRIPVSPVNDGESVRRHEQLLARGVFRQDPSGSFVHPRPPYRIDDEEAPPFRAAPRLGEHAGRIEAREATRPAPAGPAGLPLEGLRILDLTAWWAGPSATQMLALLGAEVVHVEAARRPDHMRMVGGMLAGKHADWWECSHFFLAANTNKQGLAIDLTTQRGRELMLRLAERCDGLFDNFTPRVLDGFGLGWDAIHARSPRTILVRMPAFGLTGPWRDHTGFAQTMEQMTGLAWLTGHRDDQPRIQRGPCDPLAGMHAAFAFLVALAEREERGEGVHVECTMVEGALNAAAEQLVEWSAFGGRMQRQGNRSYEAAPQGLYPCAGSAPGREQWLALAVRGDAQWRALVDLLGSPAWAGKPELASHAGRRAAHDAIDAELRPWFAARPREETVEALCAAGIPAAPVRDPRLASRHPQLAARRFYEDFDHPVVGRHPAPTLPFRYTTVERWLRAPAPTLGQHNREVLTGWLGLAPAELDALEAGGVIATRPEGV